MYRVISCAAAALLVATAIQSAAALDRVTADLRRVCASGAGGGAIAACNRLVALFPNDAHLYAFRGNAYYNKGDYDHAIADANEAMRLRPEEALFYVLHGLAYFGKGDYDQAISDYGQAIQRTPKTCHSL